MEQVADLLREAFSESMGRALEPGALTPEELRAAEEQAQELGSPDYLSLHKIHTQPEPMRTLKISARAFIRYDETRLDNYEVQGSFWLSGNVIQAARLQSVPERSWQLVEQKLCGMAFKEWKDNLLVS